MKQKIGLGTMSLLLFFIAIIWSFNFTRTFCLGDVVLQFLNLRAWSSKTTGIHYTVFYSFVFLVPAILLSKKYQEHFAAKIGGVLSAFLGLLLLLSIFGLSQ